MEENILDTLDPSLLTVLPEKRFVRIINNSARVSWLISFIIGTFLFLIYKLFKNEHIVQVGLLYVIVALIINTAIFVLLVVAMILARYRKKLILTMFLLLTNIPVVMLYMVLLDI